LSGDAHWELLAFKQALSHDCADSFAMRDVDNAVRAVPA